MNATTIVPNDFARMPGGTDFADWLSPILVKELRQGLKSRVFAGSFIIVQVVMIITMGLRLLDQSESGSGGGSGSGFDAFFWAMIWPPLLLLMPARGLRALSDESRSNTFDLVQLTKMTAFRIAFGKWIALVAQTMLLLTALLPYAVLRYYFGSVDVLSDLGVIAHLLMASMALTAGAVMLSATPLAVRVLVLMGLLPMMMLGMGGFFFIRTFGRGSGSIIFTSSSFGGPGWWLFPCMTALYVFMLLEFAASMFAPPSENHSARKRTITLLLAIMFLPAAWLGGIEWLAPLMAFFTPLIGWVAVEALTEKTVALPAIYAPFARRGFLARCVGRILYPGWATAVPFLVLMLGIMALSFELLPRSTFTNQQDQLHLRLLWPMMLFALISPLPLMIFFPRVKRRVWLYVLVQLGFMLLFVAANIAADSPLGKNPGALHWLAPFPTASLIAMTSHWDDVSVFFFLSKVTSICGLLMLAFMAVYIFREFRIITQLERVALNKTPHDKR